MGRRYKPIGKVEGNHEICVVFEDDKVTGLMLRCISADPKYPDTFAVNDKGLQHAIDLWKISGILVEFPNSVTDKKHYRPIEEAIRIIESGFSLTGRNGDPFKSVSWSSWINGPIPDEGIPF